MTVIDLGDHEDFEPAPAPPRPDVRRYVVAALLVAATLLASASQPAGAAPSVRAVGPVSSDQQSLLVGDTALGLDLTGETLSAYDAAGGGMLWAMPLEGLLRELRGAPGTAVVATDDVSRVGAGDLNDLSTHLVFAAEVRGYDARTGRQVWEHAGELLGAGELFVVREEGRLTALDPVTGAARWTRPSAAGVDALSTPDGVLLVAADGTVSALAPADGTARTLGRVHPGAEGLYASHNLLATLEHRPSADVMVLYDLRTFAVEQELPAEGGYGVWDCSGQLCVQSGGQSSQLGGSRVGSSGGTAFIAVSPDAISAGGGPTAPGTLPTGIADGWAEVGAYAGHRLALLGVPGGRTSWLGVATRGRFIALLALNAPARRCDIGETWLLCLGQTKAVAVKLSELDGLLRGYPS
ncbi:outer membrane protein assembly factor BamB family protein [Hamadaea tsunoensis]|uniref:outer membrane protein assembly factor BamB family protein n=1 Tax=Hamadaea tsunoensis TaxID=53368 RepID=UPI0004261747|nr:PQQ-binding-like beta-propeller repeat protein [Hamadaea tsunoensis]